MCVYMCMYICECVSDVQVSDFSNIICPAERLVGGII